MPAKTKKTVLDYAREIEKWRATEDWKLPLNPFRLLVEYVVAYEKRFAIYPFISEKADLKAAKTVLENLVIPGIPITEIFNAFFRDGFWENTGYSIASLASRNVINKLRVKFKNRIAKVESPNGAQEEPESPKFSYDAARIERYYDFDRTANVVWADNVCGRLSERIDQESFKQWFLPVRALGFQEGKMILVAPNESTRNWLLANYVDEITAALQAETGSGEFEIVVEKENTD